MTFNEYQKEAFKTALSPTKNISYMGLGLANEGGEVAGKLKKIHRGDDVTVEEVGKEIGDVLWYCAGLATVMNLDLGLIAAQNLIKLRDRQLRGVIKGNGDTR